MIKCDRCGEKIANAFCRCACQREAPTQSERIAELEAEIADVQDARRMDALVYKAENKRLRDAAQVVVDAYQGKTRVKDFSALIDELLKAIEGDKW